MPRTLPRIAGFLLAITIVVPSSSASAQLLGLFRKQQTTARNGRYEMSNILSDEYQRLTEMQVEMALLADISTFPYEFHAHANGNSFELSGNVPNDVIRQRAMDLARRTTVLRGIDALRIQPKLSVQSILRPQSAVLQDGFELLRKELHGQASQMSLEVRPNGVVVLTGPIDSVESKLEISKLLRRLPGCTAVINELLVEPVLLDGQRMVRVMRNNMLFLPPSVLGQEQDAPAQDAPAKVMEKRTPQNAVPQLIPSARPRPAMSPTVPLGTGNLDSRQGELQLPAAVVTKPSNTPNRAAPEKLGGDWEAFAPSKLPVKWGRPAGSWEAQTKELEEGNSLPKEKLVQTARKQDPKPSHPESKPEELVWTRPTPQPQDKMPSPIRYVSRPDETSTANAPATSSRRSRAITRFSQNFAEMRQAPEPVVTGRRPGDNEASEPKSPLPTKDSIPAKSNDVSAIPEPSRHPSGLSLQSSRRWPPAYVAGPPRSKGQLGIITFEDDPAPPTKTKTAVIATARPIAADQLQRQIKSLCGRQALEVVAAVQHDGSVQVRVKVANRTIEDQLSRKILSLPEMNSPRARLLMEIEP
jgi:osmotically-inducible protein OsmY